jgi:hypothetical protein
MRPVAAGWRVFCCDECGAQWESASRDCASPSGEDCACGNWVSPHESRADEALLVNEYGNLAKTYERKRRMEFKEDINE